MKRAVFPGSFDPLTLGHQDIVERGATIFDEIIVGIGHNAEKSHMFSIKQRKQFIAQCFQDNPKVKVLDYQGLTIDFCKSVGANYLLRGVRNNGDFEFEKAIARTNRELSNIETVFLLTSIQTSFISSSIVREIIRNKGDYKRFVPDCVRI
ncbi:MAG: pantetheine-phosphate adenylyltransferase [Flavobacteriaceae bacterium]|jgi:pantetheine-phosphate adenylyltransferase|nr:pantetheine-phosphate adenylyltransferase [Flavobacteriaceae bacterium]MBN11007.1 pantetheine-phosphate adenylyltransferase [Flavobacteriaceae bacterium]MBR63311.1 pantetheine-phosphate adenylyltransferase [Flavobacteriaceae bacterium]|tara:strand:+ start:2790 stop:3242 length:453 start_codon:yes stop_codon:yes gene_type:complete